MDCIDAIDVVIISQQFPLVSIGECTIVDWIVCVAHYQ